MGSRDGDVGRRRSSAFFFLKCKGSLLVRSGAIRSEAVGRCLLEACTVADTGEVGERRTSAVSEACLDTRESTGIGALGRDPNSSYECQNKVKRTGEHDGCKKIAGWSDDRCPPVFSFPALHSFKVYSLRYVM